jgi:pimeloyl-ACP methyl ester carboxylesterase
MIFLSGIHWPKGRNLDGPWSNGGDPGRILEHREHKVFWRAEGASARDAGALLSRIPTASWYWHRLWPELASRYRVLALDMMGYGFSQKPAEYRYSTFDLSRLGRTLSGAYRSIGFISSPTTTEDTVAQEMPGAL